MTTLWVLPLKRKIMFGLFGLLALSMTGAIIFIVAMLRSSLLSDSRDKTQELAATVSSTLSTLMLKRDPAQIQQILEGIPASGNSVVEAFVVDRNGRIAYSSDRRKIGTLLNRFSEESCRGCHQRLDVAPPDVTTITRNAAQEVHRNVMVMYNKPSCYGCHDKRIRVNGKVIIDRSLAGTASHIRLVENVIVGSGIFCLVAIFPFLSRNVDRYIGEISRQGTELTLLYSMIDRLSKTIDLRELKYLIVDIFRELFDPDNITIVIPRDADGCTCLAWKKGDSRARSLVLLQDGDPIRPVVDRWINGELSVEHHSPDKTRLFIPVSKGSSRLALIVVEKRDRTLGDLRIDIVKAMSSHISVAFENARLYYLAITDELTRLYTVRHLRGCLDRSHDRWQREGERFSLLMIDLDDFKRVNDTHGHQAGDTVLKEAAAVILSCLRDEDMAFRYGGEEFSVLLPATAQEEALEFAECIRAAVQDHLFDQGNLNLRKTVSIGVATCPDHAFQIRHLIFAADKALYRAKHQGKNTVIISDEPVTV